MSITEFDIHLHHPAPAFLCYACGDRSENLALLARVKSTVNSPASPDVISELDAVLGADFEDVREFYQKYDGILLYEDRRSDAAGLEFYPIAEWRARGEGMREQFIAMGLQDSDDPDGILNGVAFGEIRHSANYFTFQTLGPHAGTIFYVDHDSWQDEPIAPSFTDFLGLVLCDPAEFLYNAGCYTRFADGVTDTQWIPK